MVGATYGELKNLNTDDFLSPNSILCYGAGGAFLSIAPYLLHCGMKISGVIDENKRGYVDVSGIQISVESMDDALTKWGGDTIVIITIADISIGRHVESVLIEKGFCKGKIFDMNVWTWLTDYSEKSYCPYIGGYLQFFPSGLSKCCNVGVIDAYLCEWYMEGQSIAKSIENFIEKRNYYLEEATQNRIPLYCMGCSFLSTDKSDNQYKITEFITSDHTACNADCIYCSDACSMPRRQVGFSADERFAGIANAFQILCKRDILAKDALVQLASGEITILPQRRELFNLIQQGNYEVQIFSNCFIFDERIAEILTANSLAMLQCDIDAGTPETYIKIKGFNRFDAVRMHLKKYARCGRVRIKYIILPDWNDSDEDYEGMIDVLKELGLKELALSPEFSMSRESDRAMHRKLQFATARFMVLLERHGIEAVLWNAFWKRQDVAMVKRFCAELTELRT